MTLSLVEIKWFQFHTCWFDVEVFVQLRKFENFNVSDDVHTQNMFFTNILKLIGFILLKLITIHNINIKITN